MHRTSRLLPALVLAALLAVVANAQTAGDCALGSADATLDIGGVHAALYNTGGLFWRDAGYQYEVPAGSGIHAIFASGLWIGGLYDGNENDLRFAGATYSDNEFWPGPLGADADISPSDCAAFDRFWTVNRQDIVDYRTSGTATHDLVTWPIAQGAPFYVDANGNDQRDPNEPRVELDVDDPGYSKAIGGGRHIDLEAGERPDIVGDQGVWWVMNDAGNAHDWSGKTPLGVEVRVLAYTFDSSSPDLTTHTFYEYTVVNRSDTPITETRIGMWVDPDIGNPSDDYVTSDPTRGMLIAYNGDEDDEYSSGYGEDPPALGIDILSGAGAAMGLNGASLAGAQDRGRASYRLMQGLWTDGTPMTTGGDGYNPGSTDVTSWIFNGDPVTYSFWTQENVDGEGTRVEPGDRSGTISTGPLVLAPGEPVRFDIAILFAGAGPAGTRLASVQRLRDISDAVQAAYDAGGARAISEAQINYTPPPAVPSAAPTLLAPADGAEFNDDTPASVTFEWTAAEGADAYRLTFPSGDFHTTGTSLTIAAEDLPDGLPVTSWSVMPLNWGGEGPESEVREFSYLTYRPDVLALASGAPAFVEVTGPGGVDPCGADAASTGGCDEVGGNAIYSSYNGTADYVGYHVGDGPEASLGAFAPKDYEIRFTDEGSYAYYGFTSGIAIAVPFEVWDIGLTPPGADNDPSDDVQMIPLLYADGGVECEFGYFGPTQFGLGNITQRIYAYYPTTSYGDWESAIEPLVSADPNGCPTDPATAGPAGLIDFDRGRPLQRFVMEQTGVGIDELTGTVIRFYTTDPVVVPVERGPNAMGLSLAVHPNPISRAASVPFGLAAPGDVRLRVVDVLGREVAVLADGAHAAGEHRAALDASRLATGVYVVVLDADGRRATRTITVVR
ncbi:hypothetical protein [Rubrivirga marina]|uniref:Secretion system C-terminal sorting domain-containing protein n=1 Tax=Rubrivirga marina TaxID=1196024 RepID=A0A271J4X8_9BACT|nr:hypothetical protein [Rubrivirga marina]PAP78114.1 hypothetical protein BSZ37_17570 [Rubrivirga marina]